MDDANPVGDGETPARYPRGSHSRGERCPRGGVSSGLEMWGCERSGSIHTIQFTGTFRDGLRAARPLGGSRLVWWLPGPLVSRGA